MSIQTLQDKEFEDGRDSARNFSATVYVGGVIAATALFISFVLTAFPKDAYLSRVVMTLAGGMVGASMLAFAYALHHWVIEKRHRKITTWLYYGEMIFIAVNTVVSFVVLLSKVTGYDAPEWAILYEPFSVASIIYVIFAWGTVFLTDPSARIRQQQQQYEIERRKLIEETKTKYLQAPEGQADIAVAAQEEIRAAIENGKPKPFFGANGNGSTKYAQKQATDDLLKIHCMECGKPSGNHIYCSEVCEIAATERALSQNKYRLEELRANGKEPFRPAP